MNKKLQPAQLFFDKLEVWHKTGNNRFTLNGNWLTKSLRFVSQLFVVIFLFGGYSHAQVATPPAAGDGSGVNPFEITTLQNLYWVAEDTTRWNHHYIQTANIDAAETLVWFGGEGWKPIGTDATPFTGHYDGNNKVITGITINRPGMGYQGLFGALHNNASVKNLGITGVNISAGFAAGALAGRNKGLIENSYATGAIYAVYWTGGLVGFNNEGTILACYTNVAISGHDQLGGLVGWNHWATVRNSYAFGSVNTTGGTTGGLVGRNTSATITTSYSVGLITGTSSNIGGLVGFNDNIVHNSFWDTETSGLPSSAGGTGKTTVEMKKIGNFLGWQFPEIWRIDESISQDNNGYPSLHWQALAHNPTPIVLALPASNVTNAGFTANWEVSDGAVSYLIDISTDEGFTTFIPGYNNFPVPAGTSLVFTNVEAGVSFYYYRVRGVNATGTSASSNTIVVGTGFAGGDGTPANPYQISNLNELKILSETPSIWGSNFIQTENLQFIPDDFIVTGAFHNAGEGFRPIGSETRAFTGTYNGNFKTITNLLINRENANFQGLFGNIAANGSVRNIGIVGVDIKGMDNVGALAGKNNGNISNSFATGTVAGFNLVGGLTGWNNGGSISNTYTMVSVTGNDIVGGLVGRNNNSSVMTSYSAGSVSGISNVGGLIGINNDRIENSYWDMQASGQAESAGGHGRTTEEMKKAGTYVRFSFPTIWRIDEATLDPHNSGYPSLSWQGLTHNPTPIVVATRATNTSPTGFTANWNATSGATGYRLDISTNASFTTFIDGFNDLDVGNVVSYLVTGLNIADEFHYYRVRGVNTTGTGANSNTIIVGVVFSGGDGSPSNPYLVSSLDDLKFLSENPYYWDGHFKQTMNLVFSPADFEAGGNFYNNGEGFKPIGTGTNFFTGHYDGDGKVISGLFINRGESNYQGLFGFIDNAGSVSNLGVVQANVIGDYFVAALAGINMGTITNSFSTGTVTGNSRVGGLTGMNHEGMIIGSYSTANITGNENRGGLVGWNHYATISNSYAHGYVDGIGNYSGGLVGRSTFSIVNNTYSTGLVAGGVISGGLIGWTNTPVGASFWDIQTSNRATSSGGEGKTTSEMNNSSTFKIAGWVFPGIWHIDTRPTGAANNGYPSLAWQGLAHGVDLLVTTNIASDIFDVKATMGGKVVNNGIDTITERGILYSQSNMTPTLAGDDVIKVTTGNAADTFALEITGLSQATSYFFRAFAITANETGYGTVRKFVTKSSQAIAFDVLEDKTYGDAAFNLTAAATSGLAVTYLSSDESVATVTGSLLTIVGAGTTTITAIQEGNDLFAPAGLVQQILQVGKTPLVITVDTISKIYGSSDPVFTVTYNGFVYSDDKTDLGGTLEFNRLPGKNVGNYVISASGLTSHNYEITYVTGTLSITVKELTIAGSFTILDKEPDGTVNAVINQNNLVLAGVITGDDVALTNLVVEFTQSDPGNNVTVVIVSGELAGIDKDNYILSLAGAPGSTGNITTDIQAISSERIKVFPNPFVDYIHFNYLPDTSKITITDITGNRLVVVKSNGDKSLNLNYLPKGIFIITIETPLGEQSTLRVIKQ